MDKEKVVHIILLTEVRRTALRPADDHQEVAVAQSSGVLSALQTFAQLHPGLLKRNLKQDFQMMEAEWAVFLYSEQYKQLVS